MRPLCLLALIASLSGALAQRLAKTPHHRLLSRKRAGSYESDIDLVGRSGVFIEVMKQVEAALDEVPFVAGVFDEWTSRTVAHRIVFVVHTIQNNWTYQSFTLAVPVLDRSFADNIKDSLMKVVDRYCQGKVVCMTGDGANTVSAAVRKFNYDTNNSMKFEFQPCFAHALQFCFKVIAMICSFLISL